MKRIIRSGEGGVRSSGHMYIDAQTQIDVDMREDNSICIWIGSDYKNTINCSLKDLERLYATLGAALTEITQLTAQLAATPEQPDELVAKEVS